MSLAFHLSDVCSGGGSWGVQNIRMASAVSIWLIGVFIGTQALHKDLSSGWARSACYSRLTEGKREKKKCCICSIQRLPSRERPCNRFIFVSFTRCYYDNNIEKIVHIQVRQRDVQGLEVDHKNWQQNCRGREASSFVAWSSLWTSFIGTLHCFLVAISLAARQQER